MKSRYIKSILLVLVIGLCLNNLLYSQTPPSESDSSKVTVAYGNQPEWMVSSSISHISGKLLESTFTSRFTTKLFGRIPGLTVQQYSAEPGYESVAMVTRGHNTFAGNGRNMLVLIDGFESSFADLTAEEVESVTLLKDASATAMYGSRGANGVLLITTKRGEDGPLKVEFSTTHGVQQAVRLPEFLGSYDYARLYNEALINDGNAPRYSQEQLSAYQTGNDPYFYPDVNWYDEILRKSAPISNYNLNFRGGSEVVKYYVLLNQTTNHSLLRNAGDESEYSINGKYKRYNFRSNVDIDITKRLSSALTLGGTVTDQSNPAFNNTTGIFNSMETIAPNAFPVRNPDGSFGRNAIYSNPLADILNKGFFTSNARTLQSTFELTEQLDFITNGLSLTGAISFNSFYRSVSNKSRTYESFEISKDDEGVTQYKKYGLNTSLVGNEGASEQFRNLAYQFRLNYDRSFKNNALNGILLFNNDEYVISGDNFPVKHTNLSGRATYGHKQKYIAEIAFSYMGAAGYPKDNRFGFFPAASLGWIASNEGFLKDSNFISYLKFRGSYGMVGNNMIAGPPFMYEQYYNYTSQYYFGTGNTGSAAIVQSVLANPNVTWEKEKVANIGFETTILKKLDISLDVFNRDRSDIIVQPYNDVPDFLGLGTNRPYLNMGKTNSRGFEGRIGYQNAISNDLSFFVEANVWYYKNKLVASMENPQIYEYAMRQGRPIDQPFGLEAVGFFKDQSDINNSPRQIWSTVKPGDVKYKDQNGDNVIDQNDQLAIGNSGLPNLTAGLHLGAKYGNFDLDVFLQAVDDRSVYFSGPQFEAFQNEWKAGTIALNRWTSETSESATYPRLSINNTNNYRYSSLWQRDGSFIKLRNIELGYTVPARLSESINLSKARVFVSGTNLFSLDHMEGYRDPEVGMGYPTVKSYNVGVKVQIK